MSDHKDEDNNQRNPECRDEFRKKSTLLPHPGSQSPILQDSILAIFANLITQSRFILTKHLEIVIHKMFIKAVKVINLKAISLWGMGAIQQRSGDVLRHTVTDMIGKNT